jgi:hypothetical protein
METQITPRLYKVEALYAHDTLSSIFTDISLANEYESELWDDGGVYASTIYYADKSIDGYVDWVKSEESV